MSKREVNLLICLCCLILFSCGPAKQDKPTILPTITPIPGWHILENSGFQIWMPQSFVGGSSLDIDTVIPQLSQKNPNFAKIPQSLKQRGTAYIVFAVDTNSQPDKVTYMLVDNEKLSPPLEIGGYLDLLAKNLVAQYSQFNVIQKEVIPSSRYPTGKIVVELNTLESGDIKQVVYAIKNGGSMWQISFTTPTEEFDGRSPIFEQIAESATLPNTNKSSSPAGQINPWIIVLIVVVIAIIVYSAGKLIKQRQKAEPVQVKKIIRKKRAKK